MKKIISFLFFLFVLFSNNAFAAYYGYNSDILGSDLDNKYPWLDISASSATPGTKISIGNNTSRIGIPIGFFFKFAGTNYTVWRLMSNGIIGFSKNVRSSTNQNLLTNNQNSRWRAAVPFWDALSPASGGDIRYKTIGSSPNRTLIVSFINIPIVSGGTTTFQVQFFETTNIFVFKYLAGSGTNWNGRSASIGVVANNSKISSLRDIISYSYNTPSVSGGLTIEWYPLNAIHHYEIDLGTDSKGITCIPKNISIRACLTSTEPCINTNDQFSGTATVTATTNLGTINTNMPMSFVGSIDTTLSSTTVGTATLGLSGTTPKCFANGTLVSCSVIFSSSGITFNWLTNGKTTSGAGIIEAGTTSDIVKISPTSACSDSSLLTNTTKNINMLFSFNDPSTGSKNLAVTPTDLNGNAISTTTNLVSGTAKNIPFTFDSTGSAYMKILYKDAGKLNLTGTITNPESNGSTTFISKPYTLKLFNTNSEVVCSDGTILPTLSSKFCKAGDQFTAHLRAYGSDGSILPNFGQELGTANTFRIFGTLNSPSGGNGGNLKNEDDDSIETLTNGILVNKLLSPPISNIATEAACTGSSTDCFFPVNMSWDNIGSINLTATIEGDSYYGTGPLKVKTYQTFGRFYPANFQLFSSTLKNRANQSCFPNSSFSYFGENIESIISLHALDINGNITTNYSNLSPNISSSWNIGAINGTTDLSSRISFVQGTGTWNNGILNALLTLKINRNTLPDGPYNNLSIGISPIDTDGTTFSSYDLDIDQNGTNDKKSIGTTKSYFGRMNIANSSGSDLLPQTIAMTTQYFNGIGFITNSEDTSCTTLNSARFSTSNFTNQVSSNEVSLTYPSIVSSGTASVTMSKPSGGDGKYAGTFDLSYDLINDSKSYLLGNYTNSSSFTDNPKGTVTIQTTNSKPKILFLKPTP